MSEDPVESRYKAFQVPEFKSVLPPHLLGKLSEQEQYVVTMLSKMEQQNAWLISCAMANNSAIIEIDRRTMRVENWKSALSSRWALVAAFLAVAAPVALTKLADYIFIKKP